MLQPRAVRDRDDLIDHFDAVAAGYAEAHGPAAKLFSYRLDVIRRSWEDLVVPDGTLLEIGCGPGDHLRALAPSFGRGIGLDISARMIERARAAARDHHDCPIDFAVAPAEEMSPIGDDTIDAVLCVGAIEHMLDRAAVMGQVHRVLRPGGVFVCLTHNGDGLWFLRIAPARGISPQHLSTDRSLRRHELDTLLRDGGLDPIRWGYWTFVARGDMPRRWGRTMSALDTVGRLTRSSSLRGGLAVTATKPAGRIAVVDRRDVRAVDAARSSETRPIGQSDGSSATQRSSSRA